jgi:geranylgeranyl pyrophosphate synthase
VDHLLDFTVTADTFGKPVNADLSLGLATAPVLYAANEFPRFRKSRCIPGLGSKAALIDIAKSVVTTWF